MRAAEQSTLFAPSRLPRRPYCSDDVRTNGLFRQPLDKALSRSHIQFNPAAMVYWLVFDIDIRGGADTWQDAGLPPPNIAITNPANGHAHLWYGLEVPVCRTDAARIKPLEFLAVIQYSMTKALRADPCYAGLVAKNPVSNAWSTEWLHSFAYGMPELAEYLTLPKRLPKRAVDHGLGRNCTLFHELRQWAYANIREYRSGRRWADWSAATLSQAEALNGVVSENGQ